MCLESRAVTKLSSLRISFRWRFSFELASEMLSEITTEVVYGHCGIQGGLHQSHEDGKTIRSREGGDGRR